jgi:hypothetical protein
MQKQRVSVAERKMRQRVEMRNDTLGGFMLNFLKHFSEDFSQFNFYTFLYCLDSIAGPSQHHFIHFLLVIYNKKPKMRPLTILSCLSMFIGGQKIVTVAVVQNSYRYSLTVNLTKW